MPQHDGMYRLFSGLVLFLSAVLLADVASGFLGPRQPPTADEGTQAHIFQIAIALMFPIWLAALVTTRSVRAAWPLAVGAASVIVSFAAVYALEHP